MKSPRNNNPQADIDTFLADSVAKAERAAQLTFALHELCSQLTASDWHELDLALDRWIEKHAVADTRKAA
jgi:hypothetical protein